MAFRGVGDVGAIPEVFKVPARLLCKLVPSFRVVIIHLCKLLLHEVEVRRLGEHLHADVGYFDFLETSDEFQLIHINSIRL